MANCRRVPVWGAMGVPCRQISQWQHREQAALGRPYGRRSADRRRVERIAYPLRSGLQHLLHPAVTGRLSFCFTAAIRAHNGATSTPPGQSREVWRIRACALETRVFDPSNYLETHDEPAGYMSNARETGDPAFISDALGVVVRSRGLNRLATDAGLDDRISQVGPDRVKVAQVATPGQVTDTYPLALAVARGGQLATFDRRLSAKAVRGENPGCMSLMVAAEACSVGRAGVPGTDRLAMPNFSAIAFLPRAVATWRSGRRGSWGRHRSTGNCR